MVGIRIFSVLWLILPLLVACGGGGGSSGGGVNPGTGDEEEEEEETEPTPPAAWIVFRGDKEIDERQELYSVPSDNSRDALKLSSPDIPMAVSIFDVSPDGQWVAFTARADTDGSGTIDFNDGPFELFWSPVDGSTEAVKISGSIPSHASVFGINWAPDSSQLVFGSDIDTDDVDELYRVTQANPTPVKINGNVGSTVEMGYTLWSPDSRYVAQLVRNRANRNISDQVAINVYDTTLGSPNSTRITGPTLAGATFSNNTSSGANISAGVTWAPDSSRLAYLVDDRDNGTRIHYQAFPDGSYERVTATLANDENGGLGFTWSSDGRFLAYQVRTAGIGTNKIDAYDTTTGTAHRVMALTNDGTFSGGVLPFYWRPGSHEMVVMAKASASDPAELYLLDGDSTHSTLPAPLSDNSGGLFIRHLNWSPDGEHLGYLATNGTSDQASVITVAPGTSNQRVTVSSDSANTLSYPTFRWVSGNRVLYSFGDSIEIASAGESASNQTLSANLNVNVGASTTPYVQMTANPHNTVPEEQRIGFLAYREGNDVISLFTNLTDGSDLQDAGGSFVAGGDVNSFQFAENLTP